MTKKPTNNHLDEKNQMNCRCKMLQISKFFRKFHKIKSRRSGAVEVATTVEQIDGQTNKQKNRRTPQINLYLPLQIEEIL